MSLHISLHREVELSYKTYKSEFLQNRMIMIIIWKKKGEVLMNQTLKKKFNKQGLIFVLIHTIFFLNLTLDLWEIR